MPVVADELRDDAVTVEQLSRAASVFAEDEICLPQLAEHAQRDVVEVPDRRRAEGEHQPSPSIALLTRSGRSGSGDRYSRYGPRFGKPVARIRSSAAATS